MPKYIVILSAGRGGHTGDVQAPEPGDPVAVFEPLTVARKKTGS